MGNRSRTLGIVFFSALASLSNAHAYENETSFGYLDANLIDANSSPEFIKKKALPLDGTRLHRFNLALDTLGIPRETALDTQTFPLPSDFTVAQPDLAARLKIIDPQLGLTRYLKQDQSSISIFQDFFSSLLPASLQDFSVKLKASGASEDSANLIQHLQTIAQQAKDPTNKMPLKGLKVVIDPGHMGTTDWDKKGGKYVAYNGAYVSEGKLNLWTSKLVAKGLEEYGATVILTHTEEGPVASTNEHTFDANAYINQYFYNSLDTWMSKYLSLSDSALQAAIKSEPEVKTPYTTAQALQFFIGGEDLEARSKIIDQEKPDVVLDVHYDANKTNALSPGANSLEAFVPGAFLATETGSRKVREYAFKHLLDMRRFDESVSLATDITQAMSSSTGIALWNVPSFNSSDISVVKVKDGVYARNLYISRRNLTSLTVYLECLHYDDPKEYYNLAKNTETASYHGVDFQYPARLNSIANGIKTGFLHYFQK